MDDSARRTAARDVSTPGARGRTQSIRGLAGAALAIVPFSLVRIVDPPTPLASDPAFTAVAVAALLGLASLVGLVVAAVGYLLDRLVERVWLSPGGRVAASLVAAALAGAGGGLLLGGVLSAGRPSVEWASDFTLPWAAAAVLVSVAGLLLERRRARAEAVPRRSRRGQNRDATS